MKAKLEAYQSALEGAMVSHPRFGGGVIVKVGYGNPDPLVSIRFADGLRKTLPLADVVRDMQSLWSFTSGKHYHGESDLPEWIRVAQKRHAMHQVAPGDLEMRVLIAEGTAWQPAAGIVQNWAW
ncbi:hypothetical protein BAE30_08540 [Acidithiobacillus caldus]|jgi:hypothetical protein|uniref:Uncharacterized protein n=1 Tax=Acidithiobacillus caldus TaxID=33059 RepID=A0A1E7YV85_9PROT|nr:hypothetical protein BAE30_08540 [Acidithiobacillus caldus]